MAYVRRRGNQLAIVHGQRDPETKKVEQHILFTLYSKAEALTAIGKRGRDGAERFERLLSQQYPGISFPWQQLRRDIAANLDALPDLYHYRETRLRAHFRKDLCAFVRQLVLADPQELDAAAELLAEHRHELAYLKDLIDRRLQLAKPKRTEWTGDNAFLWRFALRGSEVPPAAEEQAAALYERRDFDRARAAFGLLVECFDGYAEGYNYLGLIALKEDRLDEAIGHFRKTVELGRRLFPKRIGRNRYWSDLATRPYIRGLRNLSQTLNQAGRYDEALDVCNRLEEECGDGVTADVHRAAVYLNTGRFREAADAALRLRELYPSENLVAAFALFELGRRDEALAAFLHGALNEPRTARMLAGERTTTPTSFEQIEDHNGGVMLGRALHAYLGGPSRAARAFFRRVIRDRAVGALLDEVDEIAERRSAEHPTGKRDALERLLYMRTPEFARERAAEIAPRFGVSVAVPDAARGAHRNTARARV